MEMLAIIVDDELKARLALKAVLERHFPEVTVCGMAQNAKEAREMIHAHQPHVVFLDISMPGESGFDLLENLPQRDFVVIFCTAFQQFAVRAFRASAVDYLLKPVEVEYLREAIQKVEQQLATRSTHHDHAAIRSLNQSFRTQRLERLSLQSSQGFDLVELADVHYLEADTNYTHFHLQGGRKLVVCHPLKDYEEILEPEGFFRVHRSFMINLLHLKGFSTAPTMEAVLKDGTKVEVSRRRAPMFMEEVRKFKGV